MKTYVRLMRVEHARELLRQASIHSVADVGYQTDLYDPSHFIKAFTAITGITPALSAANPRT